MKHPKVGYILESSAVALVSNCIGSTFSFNSTRNAERETLIYGQPKLPIALAQACSTLHYIIICLDWCIQMHYEIWITWNTCMPQRNFCQRIIEMKSYNEVCIIMVWWNATKFAGTIERTKEKADFHFTVFFSLLLLKENHFHISVLINVNGITEDIWDVAEKIKV